MMRTFLTSLNDAWQLFAIISAACILSGLTVRYYLLNKIGASLALFNEAILKRASGNSPGRINVKTKVEKVNMLADSINQMLDKIENLHAIEKNYVHFVAHETREPITLMLNLTERALVTKKMNLEDYEELVQQLFLQQKNLVNVTNSLLLLADTTNKQITFREVRLDELVFGTVDYIEYLYPDCQIELELNMAREEQEDLMIFGSEPLLSLAFNNLLKNAVQYSSNKCATVTIQSQGNLRQITFKNTGEMFREQDVEGWLLDDRKTGSLNGRPVSGRGLGLTLVRHIAEIHKAEIVYHHDGANVFTFRFFQN